ncbi:MULTISPECIES: FadR/GntR family transcriptional regulator [Paenalcaligenes]|uniref:GntR family transcriptional regulator n=1 Tax=Paenalcaligenes hermetiae TaxID=1157987 RepID=A0ABP9M3D2_9BURK|nr:GntR family transcriptional regulator [Paenalcaligenes sp.]
MDSFAVVYAPLGQETRTEQVVQRLRGAITSGLLSAEEQLPSESDLARMLGVSTVTVREALNTLRAQGLIDTRRGRHGGSFVCQLEALDQVHLRFFQTLTTEYISDLGEFYCALAARSAWLAAQRATQDEWTLFARLVEQFQAASTAHTRARADMRCMITLISYAQSARLVSQSLQLQNEWMPLTVVLYEKNGIHERLVTDYQQLLKALQRSDATQSRALIEQQIEFMIEQILTIKMQN